MASFFQLLLTSSFLIGWLAALAALYGRYGTLPSFLTGPNTCKLEAGGCQALFRTPTAALLGIPNSALAVLYYTLLAVGLFLYEPMEWLFGITTLAFAMTVYLAWRLVKNQLECRVCWTGHICNMIIWLVLLIHLLL